VEAVFAVRSEGIWHIWAGFDHILFLLALLLPAVLVREGKGWRVVDHFRPALISVVKVVTAFTVAHALHAGVATLHVVRLPTRLVESAIAATVIFRALKQRAAIVFMGVFGWWPFGFWPRARFWLCQCVEGLGPGTDVLALALVGFNLGVEYGQLVIVGLFLPLAMP